MLLNSFILSALRVIIYDIGIRIYIFYLWFASLFNNKAKEFLKGRKNWKKNLIDITSGSDSWVWFHCASLGEFEQGRPLIETVEKNYPQYKILLSFFSPSGYKVQKKYAYADAVIYLPIDTKANAIYFVKTVKPKLAVFVKYEFWYHHLHQLRKYNINAILVSATFRKDQPFFKWYGGIFNKILHCFTAIFVQDENSKKLLYEIGISKNVIISGDTRYDRVAEVAGKIEKMSDIERFISGKKILIAGSTWKKDEEIIQECLEDIPGNWKLIMAPHEIDQVHLDFIKSLFGDKMIFYSQLKGTQQIGEKKILVIDNIGMLSGLYAYGDIAYVGGGFQKSGIHNVLEPAVFGLPVIFGPYFQKFVEAVELKESGFAFTINTATELFLILKQLMSDEAPRQKLRNTIMEHMNLKTGATDVITSHIKESEWL